MTIFIFRVSVQYHFSWYRKRLIIDQVESHVYLSSDSFAKFDLIVLYLNPNFLHIDSIDCILNDRE